MHPLIGQKAPDFSFKIPKRKNDLVKGVSKPSACLIDKDGVVNMRKCLKMRVINLILGQFK
jgi:hypothetical protein